MRESGENPILVDTRMSMFAREGRLEDSITVTMQDVIREGEFGAHLAPDPVKAAAAFASLGIDSSHPVVLAGDYTDPAMLRIAWTLEYAGLKCVPGISEVLCTASKKWIKNVRRLDGFCIN